ncbi:UNVERIFIED_CONTAM: hypothetical protein GTU68_062924 [Idotea baltica]|nr:hypothetical protein [Idotea baltica]
MHNSSKIALILSCTPYFGPRKFILALENSINFNELIENPKSFRKQLALRDISIDYLTEKKYLTYLDKANKWLEDSKHNIISYFDDNYPSDLKELSDPPILLYCVGDISLLENMQLAIVGSRNYSTYGKNVTDKIISNLAESKITITSGLAFGIDTLAHQQALNNNLKTIAVIGTGADIIYPSNNRKLHSQIATNGLIISEFQLGVGPLRHNFPLRNRIISGLSKGVLVVEAAAKSGSLITANLALEQNKDVFAVPGSIFNITSEGCNTLISQGAKVVTGAKDIISELCANELTIQEDIFINTQANNLSEQEKLVFDCIDSKLTTIDNIINTTKLNYSEITQILFELEMQNLIQSAPGGYIK